MLFFNVFPIIFVNLLLLIFWIIGKQVNNNLTTYVTLFQMIYNLIINTIYLFLINIIHSIRYRKKILILNIIFMMLSCLIGILLHYFSWGITTGNLFTPDWKTANLFNIMLITIPIIFIIGIIVQIVLFFVYLLKWKIEKKQTSA